MKTIETLDMERSLYYYCRELGEIVVEEVSLPKDLGIVDTLSYDGKNFTCFELKVTKSDFHSKAKLSFIGNQNYFVFPRHLLASVENEVPANIGILVFDYYPDNFRQQLPLTVPGTLTIYRKAMAMQLTLPAETLCDHLLHSLNREVDKSKQISGGLKTYATKRLFAELTKRVSQSRNDTLANNLYDHFFETTENKKITALQTENAALIQENISLYKQLWNLSQQQPKLSNEAVDHDL